MRRRKCPICQQTHIGTAKLGDYCSAHCIEADGYRRCSCCWTYQRAETFQLALRPHPGIRALVEAVLEVPPPPCVCEECAETCAYCGVRQPDVEHLDGEGRCPKCAPLPLGPEIDLPSLDAYEAQLRPGLDPYEGQL